MAEIEELHNLIDQVNDAELDLSKKNIWRWSLEGEGNFTFVSLMSSSDM